MATNGDIDLQDVLNKPANKLIKLQSKDHEDILNVIDQLRSEGISKYVNLPQLIVCGDQSSGKSSVLEAISGLSFPTKDNVCTRFATELILRRASRAGVTASIHPDDDRPLAEKERLRNFKLPTMALDRFDEIVLSAEKEMGVKKDFLSFSRDILRVEVFGPTQPHLTLVDLPGLYHAPDESQSEEGVLFVESLVKSYMENRRCVMLAVISAKSDIALQKVTAFTRKLDPEGERTIGIITKPDMLARDSDMEQSFFDLAQNKRIYFRLGWHVLKNRTLEERHFSLDQRHESETTFLSQGIWSSMSRAHVGIESLRPRLSAILKDHILSQMSDLTNDTLSSLQDAEAGLRKLGQSRDTLSQQRLYLLHSSEQFCTLIKAAVDGVYSHPYFGDAMVDEGYHKRLRAVVQNRLSDFSTTMREQGEHRRIVDECPEDEDNDTCMTRSDLIEEVRQRIRRSRGRELPGTFNPLVIGEIFFLHAQPWQKIVDEYVNAILKDLRRTTVQTLQEVLDLCSVERLHKHVVNPHLMKLENRLRVVVASLLKPNQSGHPITYNHYFIETIQASREERLRKSMAEKIKAFFGEDYPEDGSQYSKLVFSMDSLLETLSSSRKSDMERFACSEAIDCMLSYYKVARKLFVDNFSSLAIEECLMQPLLEVYSPRTVLSLSDDTVAEIAKEDKSIADEREHLNKKVTTLKESLAKLQQLDLHNLAAKQSLSPSPGDEGPDGKAKIRASRQQSEDSGLEGLKSSESLDDGAAIFEPTLDLPPKATFLFDGPFTWSGQKSDKKKKKSRV